MFKVGNKVQVKTMDARGARVDKGDIGTIIRKFSAGPGTTTFVVRMEVCRLMQCRDWHFKPEDIEPVSEGLTFTRRQVIKAIENENLTAGRFIEFDWASGASASVLVKDDPNCPACVVGNLLRDKLGNLRKEEFKNKCENLCKGVFSDDDIDEVPTLLERKQYLSAISVKFENYAERGLPMWRVRDYLKRWVSRNIPARFTVRE